jgi:hypothetical protein
MSWFKKENKENIVIVRICVGCVLPYNCKLIGTGTYPYFGLKGKIMEQYYDYEIKEADLDDFLKTNSLLLIKYQLLDVEIEEKDEDKNTSKPTTIRGWTKKEE